MRDRVFTQPRPRTAVDSGSGGIIPPRSAGANSIPIEVSTFLGVAADPVERAQNAGAKVGEWVRKVFKITDTELQPNHAWRLRFKTVAREVGMDGEIRDAIQGHGDGRAASDYGEVTIKAMWNALQALPDTMSPHTPEKAHRRSQRGSRSVAGDGHRLAQRRSESF